MSRLIALLVVVLSLQAGGAFAIGPTTMPMIPYASMPPKMATNTNDRTTAGLSVSIRRIPWRGLLSGAVVNCPSFLSAGARDLRPS